MEKVEIVPLRYSPQSLKLLTLHSPLFPIGSRKFVFYTQQLNIKPGAKYNLHWIYLNSESTKN